MLQAVEFLLNSQNPDGGWGYKRGGMSFVEPTSAVLLALSPEPAAKAAILRAREYLSVLQHPDGGWGIAAIDFESGWMTGWAIWALAGINQRVEQLAVNWLLTNSGIRVTDSSDIAVIRNLLKIDPSVTGWSWQVGDASWVFPTALALIALSRLRLVSHTRVSEGITYLLDRSIPSGGWNIGNPYMVTGELSPTIEDTVISLLALQALGVNNNATQLGSEWLSGRLAHARTAGELAWLTWFFRSQGQVPKPLNDRLTEVQRKDGSWNGNPFITAIAIVAAPESKL